MFRMNNATIAILLMVVFTLVRSLPIDEEEITLEDRECTTAWGGRYQIYNTRCYWYGSVPYCGYSKNSKCPNGSPNFGHDGRGVSRDGKHPGKACWWGWKIKCCF